MLIRDGDYDFDGDIDAGDYSTWRSQFGSTGPFPINGDYEDGNRDGRVDATDYIVWRDRFAAGSSSAVGASTIGVPEPTSWLLLGCGALVAALGRIGCRSRRE